MKTCSKCGTEKPIEDFYCSPKNRDGRISWCKVCSNEIRKKNYALNPEREYKQQREWRRDNPEKVLQNSLRYRLSKLGITVEVYHQMFSSQEGKCKICDQLMASPCVDHCHQTGRVRGLLCRKCNSGIGQLQDSAALCLKASQYLS